MIEDKIYLEDLKGILSSCADNLKNQVDIINELNVFPVPDGDTGTNMNMTFNSAMNYANESQATTIKEYMDSFSQGSLLGARGNSGVILSQLIRGFCEALDNDIEYIDIKSFAKAIENSSKVAYNAVMKPTEGTILTVSKDLARSAKKNKNKKSFVDYIESLYEAGQKSLDNTPNLLPVLKEAGVVDAGGKGLLVLYEGWLNYVKGIAKTYENPLSKEKYISKPINDHDEDIDFGYCTEFIINMDEENDRALAELKEYMGNIGDSLMVVGIGNIIKVHLHTYQPNKALEKGLEYGELNEISIDNMKYQHIETMFTEEEKTNNKKYALIAVSNGNGFEDIFNSLNVDKIISGGQTMNPSTEELLSAVESINADNIFILPNNSNIILSAQQVVDMTSKEIYVIPSKTIPEGINAILAFNENLDADENLDMMTDNMNNIKSAEVTYAVRDTSVNGKSIKKDEIIGIYNKEILSTDGNPNKVAKDLIEQIIDLESDTFISIYYGEDTEIEDAQELLDELSLLYEDVDIQILYGGQPLYYYIISIE